MSDLEPPVQHLRKYGKSCPWIIIRSRALHDICIDDTTTIEGDTCRAGTSCSGDKSRAYGTGGEDNGGGGNGDGGRRDRDGRWTDCEKGHGRTRSGGPPKWRLIQSRSVKCLPVEAIEAKRHRNESKGTSVIVRRRRHGSCRATEVTSFGEAREPKGTWHGSSVWRVSGRLHESVSGLTPTTSPAHDGGGA